MGGTVQNVRASSALSEWVDDPIAGPPPAKPDVVERAGRAAADARFQAFVESNGERSDGCSKVHEPDHDYDRCVTDIVDIPVLFKREGTDAAAVDSGDIQQGDMGDCHLLASLGALARIPAGQAFLRNAVVENKNDKGVVASYTVTLHTPVRHWLGAAQTTFRDVPITVSAPYAIGHAAARTVGNENEVWPLVFEKAFAQYAGGYNHIAHGGVPADAMTVLTGREASYTRLGTPLEPLSRWLKAHLPQGRLGHLFGGYSEDQLKTDLGAGKLVVLSTKPNITKKTAPNAPPEERAPSVAAHGLFDSHAYFVVGTEQREDGLFVKLGNPWGFAEPEPIPFAELTTWFVGVSVGAVP